MPDIYVDTSGSNPGAGSVADPHIALQEGIDNATSGDTIWIGATADQEPVAPLTWNTGFTDTNVVTAPIILRGWNVGGGATSLLPLGSFATISGGGTLASIMNVTALPQYAILQRLKFTSTTSTLLHVREWLVLESELTAAGGSSTELLMQADVRQRIINCRLHTGGGSSLNAVELGGRSVMFGCEIHGMTGVGISAGEANVICNNLIYDVNGDGILLNTDHCVVFNNTLVGKGINLKYGIKVNDAGDNAHVIFNNLVTDWGTASGGGINLSSAFPYLVGNNHFFDNFSNQDNDNTQIILGTDQTTDPSYRDAGSDDYRVGVAAKGKGYPIEFLRGLTAQSLDMGGAQRKEFIRNLVRT